MGRWRSVFAFLTCIAGALLCVASAAPRSEPGDPPLPSWIREVSPHGSVDTLAQIRVLFVDPVIPLEAVESPDRQTKLRFFHVQPALPGHFIFLTPRMVGFQMDRALPLATRITVTLDRGLADLNGHSLSSDLSWSFETTPINIEGLPDSQVYGLYPDITLVSNTQLDIETLRARTTLRDPAGDLVPIVIEFEDEKPFWDLWPDRLFDPSLRYWSYSVKVRQALSKSTAYAFSIAPGVRPTGGNMPSARSFRGEFRTYDPLQFYGLDFQDPTPPPPAPLGSRYGNLTLTLRFNNSLAPGSAVKHITISPKPSATTPWLYDGGVYEQINPNALDPRTTYTFTIEPGLTDVFGQTLGTRATATYTTSDEFPDFWAMSGRHILAPAMGLGLNLIVRNLPGDAYQAAYRALAPDEMFADASDVLPDRKTWSDVRVHGITNRKSDLTLPLSKLIGHPYGALAYGIAARIPGYEEDGTWGGYDRAIPAFGIAEVTDLGIYVQETPLEGIVRVQRLSDGSNVEGASVDVYPAGSGESRGHPSPPCASATTDGVGMAVLSGTGWASCLRLGVRSWGAPILMVVAHSGGDWTFTRTDEDSAEFFGWETGPQSRGALFSDRGLYQPGETAQFTGIAYYEEDGAIRRDANAAYALTMTAPDGSMTPLGKVTTDAYGAFSRSVRFKASQTVGSYRISAVNRARLELDCYFTIAQFTPPNFEVHLTVDKKPAFAGDRVVLTAASKYLFGVPVTNAKTAFHAWSSETHYDPPGWTGFSFGRDRWWFEPSPKYAPPELTVTSNVDSQGRAVQSISIPGDLPYPIGYGVDATTTDVSNRSVADRASFVALPGDAFIGLEAPWLGDAGKPFTLKTIAVDHLGKTLPGRGITATLQRLDYGTAEDQWRPHFTTVDTATATSGDAPTTLSLTPPAAGTYRIRANFAGSSGEATATDVFVWVAGPGEVNWGDRDTGLAIHLDKKTYHVGDTATAMIEAHFVPGDLYFSIVKNRLLYHTTVAVTGSAPEIHFTVTPDMLPNAAIEAVLVRQGVPLSRSSAKSPSDLIRFGNAELVQNLDDRYLKVAVAPRSPSVGPGAPQTLELTVTDIHGKPVRSQIAVMVVNDDILQLNGYRPPDLVRSIYSGNPISSLIADNRSVMLFAQPTEPPYQYAQPFAEESAGRSPTADVFSVSKVLGRVTLRAVNDGSSKHPNVRVRTNFLQLAYYAMAVQTDSDGKASVTFNTPDDLTRWRVFAEASGAVSGPDDHDYRFGYGESTFIDTKPLLSNPLLPQFARPGDVFNGGLSVTSGTGKTGMLSIKGALVGPISFGGGYSSNSLDVAMRSGTQAFRFPITVSSVAPATIQFTTLLGEESDAFRVPLALTPLEITEQVIDSGATTTGARIPLRVDPNVDNRAGGLQLSIASTLLPQITVPAEQMLAEPCLPFLTEAAAQLSAVADMQMIADRYGQRFPGLDLRAIAARNLEVYQKLQRSDSGFDDWPGSKWQDPYSNAYAAEALARAKQAGFTVAPSFIDSSKSFMREVEKDPSPFAPYCDEACRESIRLHALVALAALGETPTENLPAVYAQRDNFSYVDRLLLARYLSAIPAWKTQAAALALKLSETIYETGRYATVNQQSSWWWWSGTESQAQAIRLYSARPASADFRDRLVRGLLAQRRKGVWSNTFDTAEALDALVDYLALESRPPKFDATASIAGRTVVAARFDGYRQPLRESTIGMASLPRGLSNVDLQKTGAGTLHYVIAYRYRLQGAQPGAMEGIRIDRKLHPVNKQSVLATIGFTAPRASLTLPAGQVYDVELVIVADHPLDQVVITDPLPAGMEAVDSSFKTATPYFQPLASAWNIDYTEIYRDRVVAFADRLGPGVYSFHYLARTVTPGTFLWPGADAHLEFAPEQFGRTASSTLRVSM